MTQSIRQGSSTTISRRRLAALSFAGACALAMIQPPSPSSGDAAPLALAPAPAPAANPRQSYLLRYKYAEGASYEYAFTIDSNGTAMIGATKSPLHSHQEIVALLTYHDVSPDGSQATVSYKYLSAKTTVNGATKSATPAQLQLIGQAVPAVRVTQSGKLASVAGAATPGPVSKMMSSAQMLQGTPLPDGPTAIGGVWRGVFSMLGANTFSRSILTAATTNAAGDQVFTIVQKISEQSKPGAPSSSGASNLGRIYIYETGTGEQMFDNTLGTVLSTTFTLSGKVTVQGAGTTIPVRTQSTSTFTMQLMPTSPATVAATGKPLPAPLTVYQVIRAPDQPTSPTPPPIPAKPTDPAQ